jgi:hypothetical protein
MRIKANWKFTIFICLLLTFIFEVAVAVLMLNEIGNDRLIISTLRLIIQLSFLVGILLSNSRILIYIITFYHVIIGLQFFTDDVKLMTVIFGIYHILIGLTIYFNEEIDLKFKRQFN